MGEKTIADVCEALIGASLLSGGDESRFDMAIEAVTIFVDSGNHKAKRWGDYVSSYVKPPYQLRSADGFEIDLANRISHDLDYRFQYPTLLRSAFTHPSYPSAWAKVPCYQRLEFLGDALLDMVCIEDLFARFPDKDPQWLTEHKVRMLYEFKNTASDHDIDGYGIKQISRRTCSEVGTTSPSSAFQQLSPVRRHPVR